MHRVLLASCALVAFSLAAPAGAGAACREGAAKAERIAAPGAPGIRTAIVVCTGGAERIVRRAILRTGSPRRGAVLTDASLRDGRLAIGSIGFGGDGVASHTVEVTSLRSGRTLLRRAHRERARFTGQRVETELLAGGIVAWTVNRRLRIRRADGTVQRPDVGRATGLDVEDGVTLRFGRGGSYDALDVAPLPLVDGCPRRGRFAFDFERGGVRVTRARYGPQGWTEVLRACTLGSGRDAVIARAESTGDDDAQAVGVVAAEGGFVLTSRSGSSKYEPCSFVVLSVVDTSTGRSVRRRTENGPAAGTCALEATGPGREHPSAITTTGAPAWLRDGVLRGLGAGGEIVELDRGAITDLRADGGLLRWRSGGADRSAAL